MTGKEWWAWARALGRSLKAERDNASIKSETVPWNLFILKLLSPFIIDSKPGAPDHLYYLI